MAADTGIVEWFQIGEHERVEKALVALRNLGIQRLRTGFSWADYLSEGGREWYEWLIPKLASEVEVLPCFHYTPPSHGLVEASNSPPRNLKDYADFLDVVLTRQGKHFEYVELWNEPNNLVDWDYHIDTGWEMFLEMIIGASYWVRHRGWKTVLGGMCPVDPNWFDSICARDGLKYFDACGIHGFPRIWTHDWHDWSEPLTKTREILDKYGLNCEVWITECGYSTWNHRYDYFAENLVNATHAEADRLYWYCLQDLHPSRSHLEGFQVDIRHYHFGFLDSGGSEKSVGRLFRKGGAGLMDSLLQVCTPPEQLPERIANAQSPVIGIFGGAGQLGSRLAEHFAAQGCHVLILDNLSAPGSDDTVLTLKNRWESQIDFLFTDVCNTHAVEEAAGLCSTIFYAIRNTTSSSAGMSSILDGHDSLARGTLSALKAAAELSRIENPRFFLLSDQRLAEASTDFQPRDSLLDHPENPDHLLGLHVAEQYTYHYLQAGLVQGSCVRLPLLERERDQEEFIHQIAGIAMENRSADAAGRLPLVTNFSPSPTPKISSEPAAANPAPADPTTKTEL
jgi:CDP-paratose 2-epimerase